MAIAIISFNYYVDPLCMYSNFCNSRMEKKIAKELTRYQYVKTRNIDERMFIFNRIGIEKSKANVLITGSSRIMQVGSQNLHKDVLNLSVSGASLEDIVTILDLGLAQFNPKQIIIGCDPWLFNELSGQKRWTSLEAHYVKAVKKLGVMPPIANPKASNNYKMLMSIDYAVESMRYLASLNKDLGLNDGTPLDDVNLIKRDGSMIYNNVYANQSQFEIIESAKNWSKYSLNPYSYSPVLMDVFSRLIDYYRKDREIILLLTPYHESTYQRLLKGNVDIVSIEKQFISIAKEKGVTLVGSYNPKKTSCTPYEFFDGAHPKDSCMQKIVKELNVVGEIVVSGNL
nr:DUF1574 family protein [Polynucleobacter sp. AP-Kaivos-20-H2]